MDQLIEGLKNFIAQAYFFDYRVYVGTLLPMGGWHTDVPFRQEMRHVYNQLIRITDLETVEFDFHLVGIFSYGKYNGEQESRKGFYCSPFTLHKFYTSFSYPLWYLQKIKL